MLYIELKLDSWRSGEGLWSAMWLIQAMKFLHLETKTEKKKKMMKSKGKFYKKSCMITMLYAQIWANEKQHIQKQAKPNEIIEMDVLQLYAKKWVYL